MVGSGRVVVVVAGLLVYLPVGTAHLADSHGKIMPATLSGVGPLWLTASHGAAAGSFAEALQEKTMRA
ncbi:hypothetical protein ACIRO1_40230 [Streptomyces sp. NPDC102381]|uniref:hypothetical protein n=1 Tax=Streptomyces sp. NPDC102381 TaxID=3366164 RepID=UPI0037FA0273